MAKHWRLCNIL